MTLSVTHTKVSAIADAGDATLVEPSDWNASHTLTGTIGVAQGGTGTGTAFTAGSVVFAGASGVYSEDNANFFWDDSNNTLKISGGFPAILYGGTKLLLYMDDPGTVLTQYNFFAGGAGNTTTSGAGGTFNTGIGSEALKALTTGDNNIAIGFLAGTAITAGLSNFCFGTQALQHATGSDNIAVGSYAGNTMTTGDGNIYFGPLAGYGITTGSHNVLIGAWQGPAGSISDVIALSDGSGTVKLDYHYTNASTWTTPSAIMVTPVAVASLPAAGISGRRHFVTNATATTFASIVAGGGANPVPVYDDGTNWRIG